MGKPENALREIADDCNAAQAVVVAWSGGLDSQVLLHLARQVKADVPVWQARPENAARTWQDEWLLAEQLEVWRTRPAVWTWLSDGVDVDLIGAYHVGDGQVIPVLFAVEQNEQGPCVYDLAKHVAPMGLHQLPFDCVLTGQRVGDEDGWGNVVKRLPRATQAGHVTLCNPLRNWTRADVEAYATRHDLRRGRDPQDGQQVRACVQCLTGNGAAVICPKTGKPMLTPELNYQESLDAWRRISEKNHV